MKPMVSNKRKLTLLAGLMP